MRRSANLEAIEENTLSENPILIVDRKGILGNSLARELNRDALVVLASEEKPSIQNLQNGKTLNIIYIPYTKKIPPIPDSTYSYMFIIDDGSTLLRESLSTFINKASQDKSSFIFITFLRQMSEKLVKNLNIDYKKGKIIICGDVFSDNLSPFSDSVANDFVYQAQRFKKIKIPGEGLSKIYPIYYNDVVLGILEATFGLNLTSGIFYLFPKNPLTHLSFSHMLQKANPAIKLDFLKKENQKTDELFLPQNGSYLLEDDYSVEGKIKEINLDVKDAENDRTLESVFHKSDSKKILRQTSFFLFLLLFFLLLPLLSTILFSFLGVKTLSNANSALNKGDFKRTKEFLNSSNKFFQIAQATSRPLLFEAKFLGKDKSMAPFLNQIEGGEKISLAAYDLIEAFKTFEDSSGNVDAKKNFDKFLTRIKESARMLEEEKAKKQIPSSISKKIQEDSVLVDLVMNLQEELPDIFGIFGKRTYLVLFQNNMELRPEGGFIGSYGTLTFDKGKITDFLIHDVYDADGQLKGHVEPPFPIRRYLPQVHWYLRDSNFDVDFPRSASASAYLFNLETGQKVDGVIGIDVSFIKNLLNAIGKVKVPEYNETVSADNLFILTQTYAEKNFFASSTQKKDFLSSLFRAIEGNITSGKNTPYPSIAKAIVESLGEKHLILAFSSRSAQNVSSVNGWSSSLWDDRKQSSSAVNDFIGVNEANLGVNKANYFIGRSLSQEVKIQGDGSVLSKLMISYRNTATSASWPGGDYKNYLRLILPLNAQLLDISIDGVSQKIADAITDPAIYEEKNFVPPSSLEVEKTEELGKTIYGFLVLIPKDSLKKIAVTYKLAQKISLDSPTLAYNLDIFKQPGTDSFPFEFGLSYPLSYQITKSSYGINNKNDKALFSQNLESNKKIFINFSKEF